MRFWRIAFVLIFGILLLPLDSFDPVDAARPTPGVAYGLNKNDTPQTILSPVWSADIRQWSVYIGLFAAEYGVDPDLIAAVIEEESHGKQDVISAAGAVGLMGVMPSGPGLESRPSTEALLVPAVNLRWGVAILTDVIHQSGGDIYAALAAYNGGWEYVDLAITQQYAANVLDEYGRAVAARSGISPDIATRWTMAIEIRRGYVSNEPLLILGEQPVSGLQMYGEHVVFDAVDVNGRSYYIKAYAVPLALVVPLGQTVSYGSGDTLEVQLWERTGEIVEKVPNGNPAVLIACLPSLSRLRGHVSTRWFQPSYCPFSHR